MSGTLQRLLNLIPPTWLSFLFGEGPKTPPLELSDLPLEILERILAELPPRSLFEVPRICPQWGIIVEENILRNQRKIEKRAKKCESDKVEI